ncbi:MAG: hypothetical protein MR016_04735 [Agathobacter sp.]|nr:hypothetical protein [Agathobacter sp.]
MCEVAERLENKGRAEGRRKEIFLSVQEGDYTVARGAQKLGISEEEFIRQMTEAGYKIPTIA